MVNNNVETQKASDGSSIVDKLPDNCQDFETWLADNVYLARRGRL